jgi:hypothetical protein
MDAFSNVCDKLGVPIADEKTMDLCTKIEILRLTIDTDELHVKIPDDKIQKIISLLDNFLSKTRVAQKELQSLTGMLTFFTRALPSGRAFSRRLYASLNKVQKSHHFIRLNGGMKKDLQILKTFLNNYNGCSYIRELYWISNSDFQLFTDSAGGHTLGCASYLHGA